MNETATARWTFWNRGLDISFGFVVTVGFVVLILYVLVARWGLSTKYIGDTYPRYLAAAQITIVVTTVSYFLGMGIGFIVGWARSVRQVALAKLTRDHRALTGRGLPPMRVVLHGTRYVLRRIGEGYVAVIRGTPLFVQIVFAWSALTVNYPQLDPTLIAVTAGVAALTLNTGAYQSEIFRAGIQTVHSGQVEAARAVGLSRWGAMRTVVLPQALRLVIPPLTNEYIGLLKASSLLLVIGIVEITALGRSEAFFQGRVFESFALVAGTYLAITVPVSKVIEYVERRYGIPGLSVAHAHERA